MSRKEPESVNCVKLTEKCPERNQKVSTSDSSQIEQRVGDRGTNQDTHKPNLNSKQGIQGAKTKTFYEKIRTFLGKKLYNFLENKSVHLRKIKPF